MTIYNDYPLQGQCERFRFLFFSFLFFISLFMYLFFVEKKKKIGSCSSCSEEKSPINGI